MPIWCAACHVITYLLLEYVPCQDVKFRAHLMRIYRHHCPNVYHLLFLKSEDSRELLRTSTSNVTVLTLYSFEFKTNSPRTWLNLFFISLCFIFFLVVVFTSALVFYKDCSEIVVSSKCQNAKKIRNIK